MSGEQKNGGGLKVNFTELIYAVVIGNSFFALSLDGSMLKLSMFIFALVIVLDDWIMYHISISKIYPSNKNYLLCSILDVIVLINWYLIATLAETRIFEFVLLTAIFYLITSLWGVIFERSFKKIFSETDIIMSFIYAMIAFSQKYYLSNSPLTVMLICFICFFLFRLKGWINLITKENLEI
jgi:hypothetical protein